MSIVPPRKDQPPARSLVNGSSAPKKIKSNPRPTSNTDRKKGLHDRWYTIPVFVYLDPAKIRERPTNTAITPKILTARSGSRRYLYIGRRRSTAPTIISSRPSTSHKPFFWCVDRPSRKLTNPLLNQYIAIKFTNRLREVWGHTRISTPMIRATMPRTRLVHPIFFDIVSPPQ